MKNYNATILNYVKNHMTNRDVHFEVNEEKGWVVMNMRNHLSPIKSIKFRFDIGDDDIIVYGFCPIMADSDDEQAILRAAEFFTRANYGMICGNFELDMFDGEIRYKVYIDCESGMPSTDVLDNAIVRTMLMYKRYGKGIVDVVFRDVPAKEAVDKCENNEGESQMHSAIQTAIESMSSDDIEKALEMIRAHLGVSEEEGAAPDKHDEPDEE